MKQSKAKQTPRGIYLLPNLLSTAGLFAAFYAIVAALNGTFDTAAIAIFVAMIADIFDGRVARLTNTESSFGGEYDSLCDMVSFGVAPALVAYSWVLHSFGKLGWLVAFMYTATSAMRLARFNTQIGVMTKEYFQGLPTPAAAGIIASSVWFFQDFEHIGFALKLCIAIASVLASVLMVSNVRYYSFKELDLKGRVPFIAVVLVMLIYVAVSINPPFVLLLGFVAYAISGPVMTLIVIQKRKRERKKKIRSKKK